MGMYDTIYAELDCPFCGKQYRYSPMTWEEAEQMILDHKQSQLEYRGEEQRDERPLLSILQPAWARQDGFDDVDAWIKQLDMPENIEAYRTRKHLGLAEIQTKAFERAMQEYYVSDELPVYPGHYFIPEAFYCEGCGNEGNREYVKVWVEIENLRVKAVHAYNPETGEPEKASFSQQHRRQADQQGSKSLDKETGSTPKLSAEFSSPDDHLTLKYLGQTMRERLHAVCRHLPTDFDPYGKRDRNGSDCSCGCQHFLTLPGRLRYDWGVCINPRSPRSGLLTFEHQGCEFFEPVNDAVLDW